MVIGPNALALAKDSAGVRYLAEFGVVFLMFVIGLEFNLPKLKSMKHAGVRPGLQPGGPDHARHPWAGHLGLGYLMAQFGHHGGCWAGAWQSALVAGRRAGHEQHGHCGSS